jgi:hypothetical protein
MLVWRVPEQATRATWTVWANMTASPADRSGQQPAHCLKANITL